jgi:hypothetical protein
MCKIIATGPHGRQHVSCTVKNMELYGYFEIYPYHNIEKLQKTVA